MITSFEPIDHGFYYDEDYQEWIKLCGGGQLILYTKLTSWNTWSLSYVDNEDNQKFLVETDDTEILLQNIKQYQRDYKIDEILE
jgi:hypothetical protein